MKFFKGQISLMTAIIGASGMILASVFTSWFSASERVYKAESKIQIVEERENNHYQEVKEQLNKIDVKLDKLLDNSFKK